MGGNQLRTTTPMVRTILRNFRLSYQQPMNTHVIDVVSLPFHSCFFFSSAFSDCRRHIDDNNAFCKTLKNTIFAKMLYLEDYLESKYMRYFIFSWLYEGVYLSLRLVFRW